MRFNFLCILIDMLVVTLILLLVLIFFNYNIITNNSEKFEESDFSLKNIAHKLIPIK